MKQKHILEQELGTKVFLALWNNPNGLSGYEIGKIVFGSGTQGKTYTILNILKKHNLIDKRKRYVVNFDGLVEYINKRLPSRERFNKIEREYVKRLLSLMRITKSISKKTNKMFLPNLFFVLSQLGMFGISYKDEKEKIEKVLNDIKSDKNSFKEHYKNALMEAMSLPNRLLLKLVKLAPDNQMINLIDEIVSRIK